MTRTRKFFIMCLAVLMTAAAFAAPAEAGKKKKPKPRTAEEQYISFPGVFFSGIDDYANVGGAAFDTQVHESFVDIEITDLTGLPAPAGVGQDADGNGELDSAVFFCGSTTDVAIVGGVEVTVFAITSPVCINDLSPGLATTGTIKATFSSTP